MCRKDCVQHWAIWTIPSPSERLQQFRRMFGGRHGWRRDWVPSFRSDDLLWPGGQFLLMQIYRLLSFIKILFWSMNMLLLWIQVCLFFQRWFSKLPPVLTFELSRFEFNQSLGRPEKIHKKLEFPQVIYMDRLRSIHPSIHLSIYLIKSVLNGKLLFFVCRYLHNNVDQTHGRRGEVKRLKDQLTVLQQKLEGYVQEPNRGQIMVNIASNLLILFFGVYFTIFEDKNYDFLFQRYKNYGSGPTKYPLADMLQYVLEFATTKPTNVSPASPVPTNPPVHTEPSSGDSRQGSLSCVLLHRLCEKSFVLL